MRDSPKDNMLRNAFVLKWNGWRQFARDFAAIQIGFFLFGVAIVIMYNAGLGTSPWLALEVALTRYLPLTLGQAVIVVAAVIIVLDVLLGQPLGWGSVANMLSIGVFVDLLRPVLPVAPANLWLQVPYLLLGILTMGFATALYVGVNAGAGPRDSLMLAISRLARISVRRARTYIEIAVVSAAWLLGGTVGVGTLLFAVAIGPAVQLGFRLLRVTPMQPPARISPQTASD
jgi:uncharacterized protein